MIATLHMAKNRQIEGWHFLVAVDEDGDIVACSTTIEPGNLHEALACENQMQQALEAQGYSIDTMYLPWRTSQCLARIHTYCQSQTGQECQMQHTQEGYTCECDRGLDMYKNAPSWESES